MQYDYQHSKVHFIGSVAFHYKEILAEAAQEMGVQVNTVLQLEQLVRDDNLVFAATGITNGDLLKGIHRKGNLATTETLLIRGKSRTIRRIQSTHYLDRKDTALSRLIGA